jgi:hypothetical protein
MKRRILILTLVSIVLFASQAATAAPKTLLYDFYFDNTSLEPTSDAERARIAHISDVMRASLQKSGKYDIIDQKAAEKQLSDVLWIGHCNGCELGPAQKTGAQLVAYGWVQKVSNLILNLNIVIEDAKTGNQIRSGSVDIRGNTVESWDRGARYLLEEHVFNRD